MTTDYKEKQKNLITLPDGRTVNRDKVFFTMRPSRINKNIVIASDNTSYRVGADGGLTRMNIKETRQERKERKKEMKRRGKK